MKSFEILDISGDAGIRAYGQTIEDVFANAATGMYSLITNLDDIRANEGITVEVESHSAEGLLVSWLNELIFQFDTHGFIAKTVEIASLHDNRLAARLTGEGFDPERHERRLLIKAATYHQLSLGKKGSQWTANVIFDI